MYMRLWQSFIIISLIRIHKQKVICGKRQITHFLIFLLIGW